MNSQGSESARPGPAGLRPSYMGALANPWEGSSAQPSNKTHGSFSVGLSLLGLSVDLSLPLGLRCPLEMGHTKKVIRRRSCEEGHTNKVIDDRYEQTNAASPSR